MTSQAERIKERNRGWRRAQPASDSRLAALNTFGLRYERVDDFNVIVEGRYQLNLAMSFWRSDDGTAQGYLVSTLDAEIKKRTVDRLAADVPAGTNLVLIDPFNSRKPAAGRDSVAANEREISGKPVAAVAESAAGPTSFDTIHGGTASLLPVVSP